MWGGRFQEQTDAFVEAFTASVKFDQRLAHTPGRAENCRKRFAAQLTRARGCPASCSTGSENPDPPNKATCDEAS